MRDRVSQQQLWGKIYRAVRSQILQHHVAGLRLIDDFLALARQVPITHRIWPAPPTLYLGTIKSILLESSGRTAVPCALQPQAARPKSEYLIRTPLREIKCAFDAPISLLEEPYMLSTRIFLGAPPTLQHFSTSGLQDFRTFSKGSRSAAAHPGTPIVPMCRQDTKPSDAKASQAKRARMLMVGEAASSRG
jgi:hypothetical protein